MANGSPFINTQAGEIIMRGAQMVINAHVAAQQLQFQREQLTERIKLKEEELKSREQASAHQERLLELRTQIAEATLAQKQAALEAGPSPSGQQTARNLLIAQIDERVRALTMPGVDVSNKDVGDIDVAIADADRQLSQIEGGQAAFMFTPDYAGPRPPRWEELKRHRALLSVAKDTKFRERERLITELPTELQALVRAPATPTTDTPTPTGPGREPIGATQRSSSTRTQRRVEFAQLLQSHATADTKDAGARQRVKDSLVDTLMSVSKDAADPTEQDARITEMYDQMTQYLDPALVSEIVQSVTRKRATP